MSDPRREVGKETSLRDTRMSLSGAIQALVPEAMLGHYEQTNRMHCGPGEGGSKFDSISNIFEVLEKAPDLARRVAERTDDREALIAAGAQESAFLPATKGPEDPAGLPEGLYFKVDGVEGRLGIIKLADLPPETKLLVMREKGGSNPAEKGYVPASFTVVQGTVEDMPKVDFATVIVGRSGGDEGENAVWTIHPGPPARPVSKDYDWSKDLRSPDETSEGEKQGVRVVTVAELLLQDGMSPNDFVKLAPGNLKDVLEKYQVMQ